MCALNIEVNIEPFNKSVIKIISIKNYHKKMKEYDVVSQGRGADALEHIIGYGLVTVDNAVSLLLDNAASSLKGALEQFVENDEQLAEKLRHIG